MSTNEQGTTQTPDNTLATPETPPTIPERVEKLKKPAAAKIAHEKTKKTSKAVPKTEANSEKKALKTLRKARKVTRAKKGTETTLLAEQATGNKKRGRPKGSKSKKPSKAAKRGRTWPVVTVAIHINVLTQKPKALTKALNKVIKQYAK